MQELEKNAPLLKDFLKTLSKLHTLFEQNQKIDKLNLLSSSRYEKEFSKIISDCEINLDYIDEHRKLLWNYDHMLGDNEYKLASYSSYQNIKNRILKAKNFFIEYGIDYNKNEAIEKAREQQTLRHRRASVLRQYCSLNENFCKIEQEIMQVMLFYTQKLKTNPEKGQTEFQKLYKTFINERKVILNFIKSFDLNLNNKISNKIKVENEFSTQLCIDVANLVVSEKRRISTPSKLKELTTEA